MNVQPNDLAMLIHPVFPENKGRICTVLKSCNPNINPGGGGLPTWICEYPTEVMTSEGPLKISTTEDWRLMKIAGPDIDIGIVEHDETKKQLETME